MFSPRDFYFSMTRTSLNARDCGLIALSLGAVVLALMFCWIGVSRGQTEILEYEAERSAEMWGKYLKEDLEDLPNILSGGELTGEDRADIEAVQVAGGVFRYKLFGADGLIVHATRPEDVGKTNTKPYFHNIVRKGGVFSKIERDEDFGTSHSVVSEAYVPIMDGDKFLGAIELYVDVTPRAVELREMARTAFLTLLGLLLFLAATVGILVLRHIVRNNATNRVLRENQAALIEARKDAEVASAAKSEFVATISHELRTPMNGVLGMAGLLMASELNEEQRQRVGRITESGQVLLSLLNNILDVSKIESGVLELENVNFSPRLMLDSVTALLESPAQQKGLTLTTDIAPDVPKVLVGDLARIRQVIFNLVGNAIKFTADGGVSVRMTQGPMKNDGIDLRIDVTDTGIGIPAEALNLIFEKFSQADSSTNRKYGGTGLGLAICKDLVGMMGGSITIDSVPGQGATFSFNVECARANPGTAADADMSDYETPGSSAPIGRRALRILVAEDNVVNQEIAIATLEKAGYVVDVVSDGAEAVEAVKSFPYHVILMDIRMPVMDGLAATREIRALPGVEANVPIIALTADAMLGDEQEYLSAGMNSYASKPFDPDKLFATIEALARPGTDLEFDGFDGLSDTPVLDQETIEGIRNLDDDGSSRVLGRVVSIFLDTTPLEMAALLDAIDATDLAEVERLTHSLKTSCANVGALELSNAVEQIFIVAQRGDVGAVQSWRDFICTESDRAYRALSELS